MDLDGLLWFPIWSRRQSLLSVQNIRNRTFSATARHDPLDIRGAIRREILQSLMYQLPASAPFGLCRILCLTCCEGYCKAFDCPRYGKEQDTKMDFAFCNGVDTKKHSSKLEACETKCCLVRFLTHAFRDT